MSGITKIRIGVSACLLGERVRYDGDHKRDPTIADTLAPKVEWVPICPEVAIGMGVPRSPIRLVQEGAVLRAVGVDDPALEVTAPLSAYGRRMSAELHDIDGYVFKARSPSCGIARVEVLSEGRVRPRGSGLYTHEIMVRCPLLPVAEGEQLHDAALLDNFLERVFAHRRWRRLVERGFAVSKLVEFHSDHKLSLMAHGAVYYRALGRLVADGAGMPSSQLCELYSIAFMAALKHPATAKRNANVLQHLLGYLKKHLTVREKQELLESIDAYCLGRIPLNEPQNLLRKNFKRFPSRFVARQLYLYPESEEARVRCGAAFDRAVE